MQTKAPLEGLAALLPAWRTLAATAGMATHLCTSSSITNMSVAA